MNASAWERAKSLLADAADLPATDRERFVSARCSDLELRRELLELLASPAPLSDILAARMLRPGTRVGPYVVERLLGAGGMGEVYRASDTRLDRTVAMKVLPAHLVGDVDRRRRFEREARAISKLNHPHICTLYDIGSQDGMDFLVMEYVDGETLASRLARGPIPMDQVLRSAIQIAEALDEAHRQGIIHRDLKPGNIMLTRGGVKLLDFGLAKPRPGVIGPAPGSLVTDDPQTVPGEILGTLGYMAPEQIDGVEADARADIFALGAILYEMATAKRALEGRTRASLVAATPTSGPVAATMDLASAFPLFNKIVLKCLATERDARWHSALDLADVLRWIGEESQAGESLSAPAAGRGRLAWAVATLTVIGLATVPFLRVRETPVEPTRAHLSVPLPGNAAPGFFALSPDGRSLVIGYQNELGIRSVESGEIRLLTGARGARTPFWSPDSRAIGFFADGKLKTIAASGGPPQTLCDDVGLGGGGAWNRAGVIIFATDSAVLTRVPAAGGACTALTKPEPDNGRPIPVFLPDGDHFLYVLGGTDEARRGLYVASLGDANGRRLLVDPSSAVFVPNGPGSSQGRLLFVREQTLTAQTFDATSLQLSGEPVTVAKQVSFTNSPPQIAASADTSGTVVYLTNGRPQRQLIWYDRSGTERGRAAMTGSGPTIAVSLAPDGHRVTFRRTDAQGLVSLWVQDLERNQETRLTTPPLVPSAAVWAPDGQRIAFRATGAGADGIYIKNVNGGKEALLLPGSNSWAPSDWSRDDHWLVYTEINSKTGADIWLLADPSKPSAERKPVPLLRTRFIESQGQISPDGKWLAYVSNESGTSQVYLRPFRGLSPASDTSWQVSSMNGADPRWRADGKELFFLVGTQWGDKVNVMAVAIGAAPNPAGTPTPLFEFHSLRTIAQSNSFLYSPAADGQRFLVNTAATEVKPSLEVILNWGRTSGGQ